MKFIREKKIKFGCGYLDVDIYEMDDSFTPPEKKSKTIMNTQKIV